MPEPEPEPDLGRLQSVEALERAAQELEALESIYGYEPDGFTVHSDAALELARAAVDGGEAGAGWAPPALELELRLELDVEGQPAVVARLRLSLPPGYPTAASARVSVSIEGLRRRVQDDLTAAVQTKADALLGEEAVMELAQELQEIGPGVLANEQAIGLGPDPDPDPEQNAAAGGAVQAMMASKPKESLSTVLFHIDHMNDSTTYIQKLRLWSEELNLGVVLLYRMRTKAVNASSGGKSVNPKGRAEAIWVLLDGNLGSTKEFLSRLRTQPMTGQDRHERKSTVIWDNISGGGAGGVGGASSEGRPTTAGFVTEMYSTPTELRECEHLRQNNRTIFNRFPIEKSVIYQKSPSPFETNNPQHTTAMSAYYTANFY